MWDPATYLRFADERSRPFFDLVARIGAQRPRTVVDLGCGPGNLTAALAQRWPGARVRGIDLSAEMIAKARAEPSTVAWRTPPRTRSARPAGSRLSPTSKAASAIST